MAPTSSAPKPDMKVIGVGLGRTGTKSMSIALNMLGFGPCYHMETIFATGGRHIPLWKNVDQGINPTENLYEIFQGFQSGTDYPEALYPEELYKAFPDAKFILSVRPVSKWKASFANTIAKAIDGAGSVKYFSPFMWSYHNWITDLLLGPKHLDGDLEKNAEKVWYAHIERVKSAIPANQLLIYEVGDGWEKLCAFLDVPVPQEEYPQSNDTGDFHSPYRLLKVVPFYLVPILLLRHFMSIASNWVGFIFPFKAKSA